MNILNVFCMKVMNGYELFIVNFILFRKCVVIVEYVNRLLMGFESIGLNFIVIGLNIVMF